MSESSNVSHWIDLIKQGDSAAANRLWGQSMSTAYLAIDEIEHAQIR